MMAETEVLLFEASRSQLVREVIKPALERGVCVIADRLNHDEAGGDCQLMQRRRNLRRQG